jgi:hypothetical protein
MPPIRIDLVPRYGKGEVVLRAYECLGQVGIAPVRYSFNSHSFNLLSSKTRERALAIFPAAGFEIGDA